MLFRSISVSLADSRPESARDPKESDVPGAPIRDVPQVFCLQGASTQVRVILHCFAWHLLILICSDDLAGPALRFIAVAVALGPA